MIRARWRAAEGALLLVFAAAVSFSIALTEIAFLTALASRLVRAATGEPFRLRPRAVLVTGLILAATWILAGVFSPAPAASIARVSRLYQVFVVFLVAEWAADPRWVERAVLSALIGSGIGAAAGLVVWLQGDRPRMLGVFSTGMTSGNSSAMSLVGAVAAAVAWRGRKRIVAGVAEGLDGFALLATMTRSAWLGAGLGILAVGTRPAARKWAVATILLLVLTVIAVPRFRARGAEIGDTNEVTAKGRISLWLTGWELFRERPILGWGLQDHYALIEAHRRPDATFHAGHFHNNAVQVAVSTGIVGSAAYAAFHLALLAGLWRRRRRWWGLAALGVWVAFELAGFFDWSFGDAEVAYAFFLWMGLGSADNQEQAGRLVDPA
ncbi:MAG TPA: O-antigen ligase family protein [Candidatus Eisenbacteria bacterium]|nr:O-antigen ligase family protein [Candidatus Eisenbacteria bacterium]